MGRRSSASDSSLELLLDTICNTFGGVLFLAMLVSLLLTQTRKRTESESESADPVPAVSTADLVRLDTRAEILEHEIQRLEKLVGDVEGMTGEFAEPGYKEKLEAMQTVEREQRALAAKRVRVLSDIADAQAAAARAGAQTATTQRQQKAADADQSQAENRLEQAKLEREQLIQSAIALKKKAEETTMVKTTGRAPRERETSKREFGAVLKYGRMYLMHVYRSGEREVNTEEFVVTTGLQHNTAEPKPSAGLDLRASDSLQSIIRQRLNAYPPGSWYMCLVVHPDSFEEFLSLKAAIVSLGYEYRLMPTNKGVMDTGGSGGNVQ